MKLFLKIVYFNKKHSFTQLFWCSVQNEYFKRFKQNLYGVFSHISNKITLFFPQIFHSRKLNIYRRSILSHTPFRKLLLLLFNSSHKITSNQVKYNKL